MVITNFMEMTILKEDKETIELKIEGQEITICNLFRDEISKLDGVEFAAYNLKHPQATNTTMEIKMSKGKPKKAVEDAADSIKSKIKEMKNSIKKL